MSKTKWQGARLAIDQNINDECGLYLAMDHPGEEGCLDLLNGEQYVVNLTWKTTQLNVRIFFDKGLWENFNT